MTATSSGWFFVRKERWGLTWKARLFLGLSLVLAVILAIKNIFPFLAVPERAKTDILVVEGWIPNYAIAIAADEFRRDHYRRVFATGGPVMGMGGYTNDYNTSANVGLERLIGCGIPAEAAQMAPSRVMARDRTFAAAIALREYFEQIQFHPLAINVMTEALHARRTHFLFQKAFANNLKVGIIAIPSPDNKATKWWQYSESVREVLGETIAYLYAILIFHAKNEPPKVVGLDAGELATCFICRGIHALAHHDENYLYCGAWLRRVAVGDPVYALGGECGRPRC